MKCKESEMSIWKAITSLKLRNSTRCMKLLGQIHIENEFYLRWLENIAMKIGNAVSFPLILNHLNWNPFNKSMK